MTFSDNALAETAPVWDARAIRLPLTASIDQATTHKEGAARRSSGRRDHLPPRLIHRPSQGRRRTPEDGSQERVCEYYLVTCFHEGTISMKLRWG